MDFELTDEQRLIKETAREFTDKEIVIQSRENARNHHFDLDLVKKVSDDKVRRVLGLQLRTSEEAIVAAGRSMIAKSLVKR